MNPRSFFTNLATLGPIGHLQAPGTWGSIGALLVIVPGNIFLLGTNFYWQIIVLLVICSAFIIHAALAELQRYDDPQEIVLDEVAGMIIAFAGVPLTFTTVVVGFCLFRVLDIFKPFGISYLQNISHSSSVILDDCVAGLITCGFLHLLLAHQLL